MANGLKVSLNDLHAISSITPMKPKISRKINWISSLKENSLLIQLEESLSAFYTNDRNYFSNIDFTVDNWIQETEKGYLHIIEQARSSKAICEVGCGNANFLKHYPEWAEKYTGLDFSEIILRKNSEKYPAATFLSFKQANQFPVPEKQFDLVFSVFVLEHVTRPATFLDECKRILKPGGVLVILCPDFLGRGRMTSQRSGFSQGNSSTKFRQRKYFDAVVTLFDNRIKIPLFCKYYRYKAMKKPLFLVNVYPTVFEDNFEPDVDAVYLTSKNEIIQYLGIGFQEKKNDKLICDYELKKKIIYLQLIKNT